MTGPLLFVAIFAALIVLWGLDKPSVPSVYARLRPSPSRRGAGLPPGSAPAGEDWRPLLTLIDERPVDVFAARRALNDNAAGALDPPPAA